MNLAEGERRPGTRWPSTGETTRRRLARRSWHDDVRGWGARVTEGGDPDKLGRAALWLGEIDLCVHQNHIFKVRSHRDHLVPEYLRSLAGSAYGKAYFLSVAKKTTGIASINKTQLSAFPVLLPPQAEQEKFKRQVEAVEAIVALQNAAAIRAEVMFGSLLARAFSDGQKREPQCKEGMAVA